MLDGRKPTIKVIDLGAMSLGGEGVPYRRLVAQGACEVIGFEPVEKECEKLNAQAGPKHRFLPYAVGDGKRGVFRVCKFPMTSSLFEPNTALLDKFHLLADVTTVVSREDIETRRLDDIPEATGADYVKADVQGAEVMVFDGGVRTLETVTVVHTEVEFIPLYKDQPLFAEVDQALRRQGFLFHKFMGTVSRALKPLLVKGNPNAPLSQVLWGDAIYVKDFTAFDRLEPERLLKLAIILHEVYQSFDLAALALQHHDKATGGQLCASYLQRLTGGRTT
ncbi:MAG: FkbM family methyltransferase [Alphaproteobacteria bacterium]